MEEQDLPPDGETPQEPHAEPEQPETALSTEELIAPAEPAAEGGAPSSGPDAESEAAVPAKEPAAIEPVGEAETPVSTGDSPTERGAEAEADEPAHSTEPVGEAETPAESTVSMEELMSSTEQVAEAAAPVSVEDAQLKAVLEALVYVAEEPLTLAQIAAALQQPAERVRELIGQLVAEFDKPEHGVTIREVAGGYKMATKPEHHEAVRAFVKSLKPPLKLSLPALETLAVIAYKQPVTAPEIMEIRGVQGAGVLKTLLDRKLIAAAGRKNVIGKPILYKTTKEFLIQFGLKDLSELPSLKEFEEIRRMAFADSEVPESGISPVTEAEQPPAADTESVPSGVIPSAEDVGQYPDPEQAAEGPSAEPEEAPEPVPQEQES
jgi:segregation and condensation protein B